MTVYHMTAVAPDEGPFGGNGDSPPAEAPSSVDSGVSLVYHNIRTYGGNILPWYSPTNRGASYDHVIRLCFDWWEAMDVISGDPYEEYICKMIYVGSSGGAGTGGDQLAMALRAWRKLYAYWGDSRIVTNMTHIADTYLAHSLSSGGSNWPNLPYPYQTGALSTWNGDYIAGSGYLQPDKAGSFGHELLVLYKMTADSDYLTAAVNIGNTLASKTVVGDGTDSPLPYRVRASDGSIYSHYCGNWMPTLRLWEELAAMGQGNDYTTARSRVIAWLKAYPVSDNHYGPFFEDISAYSDASRVGDDLAMYIMDHRVDWGSSWDEDARAILDEIVSTYGNNGWSSYGVRVTNEQTEYQQPGNSHSSNNAATELRYAELTGNTDEIANAIRQLSWATYMVDTDGKNQYPDGMGSIWLTDGYGDYVEHYLDAMAAAPYLSPSSQDHILRASDVVKSVTYGTGTITYECYGSSREKLRVTTFTPTSVTVGGVALERKHNISDLDSDVGWTYDEAGGLDTELNIRHAAGEVVIS